MFDDLTDKKYPSIMVQSVLLASSLLYLEHGKPNKLIIFTIFIILSLFMLQAINHRFFYYFPINRFMGKETKDLDTYTLYLMTFTAYLLFIWGIAESFLWAIILAPLIFFSGFIWKRFMYEKVRERITRKLKREKAIEIVKCPHCGSEAIIEKTVLEWNKGCKIFKCDKCNKKLEMEEVLNIG